MALSGQFNQSKVTVTNGTFNNYEAGVGKGELFTQFCERVKLT